MEKEQHYRAVAEMAALLRETTSKDMIIREDGSIFPEYGNIMFSKTESIMVKNKFLKLVSEL